VFKVKKLRSFLLAAAPLQLNLQHSMCSQETCADLMDDMEWSSGSPPNGTNFASLKVAVDSTPA
jgi:hypothetical protein